MKSATIAGANANRSPKIKFPVRMFKTPSIALYNPTASNAQVRNFTDGADHSSSSAEQIGDTGFSVVATGAAGTAVGEILAAHWAAEAEI